MTKYVRGYPRKRQYRDLVNAIVIVVSASGIVGFIICCVLLSGYFAPACRP